jgi:hypothetical protein
MFAGVLVELFVLARLCVGLIRLRGGCPGLYCVSATRCQGLVGGAVDAGAALGAGGATCSGTSGVGR